MFEHEWRERTGPYGQSRTYISHASPTLAIGGPGLGVHFAEEPHPAYNHHHRGRHATRSNHQASTSSGSGHSGVTIEELPASDEEVETEPQAEQKPSTSRLSFPSIPRISRRSPQSKERAKKASSSKRSKKY